MAERPLRKTRVGQIVSDKMDKTVVVAVGAAGAAPAVRPDHPADHDNQGTR